MKEKLCCALAALLSLSLLSGCGSVFDKEYVQIEDYVPTVQYSAQTGERVTVHNFAALKQTIRSLVSNGESDGSIILDADYDGDATEDMASACWQVRTQDALCAYCVDNISYELTKIVTYYEAKVHVRYAASVENAANIVKLPYSTGVERLIKTALEDGQTKLVVLINRSSFSAEDMEGTVARVYRENPVTAPKAPAVSVNIYSGANMQCLYEINLRYGMPMDELVAKKKQLDAFDPFRDVNIEELDEGERALMAYEYLLAHCKITDEGQGGSIYSALIEHASDSEGAALAYVQLCRLLGVDCRIVYGQRDWADHCWNIVRVNGEYYHVDAGLENASAENNFLKPDQSFWESYRWDVASYPACTGSLTYEALVRQADSTGEEKPDAEDRTAPEE